MAYIDTNYRLKCAVREGNLERARELLTYLGLSYLQTWSQGYDLLCVAIRNRHTEVIKLLLTNGCKVNSYTNKSYNTPLHFAVIIGDIEIVKMLLDRGANVNTQTQLFGTTPLHDAMDNEEIEIAELLLNHGANVNASNKSGDTPLWFAVYQGHVDTVKMLLDRGANINTISYKNYRRFYESFYCEQIAEILKQHIVKMKTAKLYVSEHLSMRCNYENMKDLQDKCEKEVAIMKNEKISNINISFYDILIKDTTRLAIYMRNVNVVQVLRSDEYKTKFPIYASMIKNMFRKGMERKELLEQGTKIFYFFCNFPELPHECIEQIFSYLSDNDVRILIDTCKSVSVSNLNTDINDVTITSNTSKVLCV